MPFEIERIYLDEKAAGDWVSRAILKNLPHVPVEEVRDKKVLIKEAHSRRDPIGSGKKDIFITRFHGKRVKPCPGTSRHICCGYHVINAQTNCPMDCSYCVLQGYLNNPFLTLYSNWEELLGEVESFLSREHPVLPRIGTGEFSDSLALDPIFPISSELVRCFAEKERGVLELKTKTSEVGHLMGLEHREKTIVSWSLNPSPIIQLEEKGTASLEERMDAAYCCQQRGYPVGFHFDPLIQDRGWEHAYEEVVERLSQKMDSGRIAWISLGGFRYPGDLKGTAQERFPRSRVFLGELFPCKDGKFRYLREIRVEMYRKLVDWLREWNPDLFIYLCMESREVWMDVFGWSPSGTSHLSRLFEEQLKKMRKE
jgi:spore photoproduct lyase